MVKCLIIEDEPLAIALLKDYIHKTANLELVAAFSDPILALQKINELEVDLIFLDVQMPELNGIQLLKIFNQKYKVVLTTAYQEYAVDGFDYDVVDYLLKPISYDRFFKAIQKVEEQVAKPEVKANAFQNMPGYIFVKSEYRIHKIDLESIYFLEGLGDYVAIHLVDSKILTLENLKHFEQTLPQSDFIRVHKSFIISLSRIDYIERSRILMKDRRIPISESYKKAFFERIKRK